MRRKVLSTTYSFCNVDSRGKPALPQYDWYMLLVAILIESLDNKHDWNTQLKQESSDLICDDKLKTLLSTRLEGCLGEVLRTILGRLDSYRLIYALQM